MGRLTKKRIGFLWPELKKRLADDEKAILAVSGGPDSIAMLYLCLPPPDQRDRVLVAHIHHGTDHANAAEQFVKSLCIELDLGFRSRKVDLDSDAIKRTGFEAVAREARYTWFKTLAKAENCSVILTGHNQDDRAESVLMYMMRGARPGTLAGPRAQRDNLWRPLIAFSREEILDYLDGRGIVYVSDPSNADNDYSRNKIRNLLKPELIEHFGSSAWRKLGEASARIEEYDKLVTDGLIRQYDASLHAQHTGFVCIDSEVISGYLPEAQQWIYNRAWQQASISSAESSKPKLHLRWREQKKIQRVSAGKNGDYFDLPGSVRARKTTVGLTFDGSTLGSPQTLSLPGELYLSDGSKLTVTRSPVPSSDGINAAGEGVEYLDLDSTGSSLKIRAWQHGDRFTPLGRPGSYSNVSGLVPSELKSKRTVWVAENESEIVAVLGLRISHDVRVRSSSTETWCLNYTPPFVD